MYKKLLLILISLSLIGIYACDEDRKPVKASPRAGAYSVDADGQDEDAVSGEEGEDEDGGEGAGGDDGEGEGGDVVVTKAPTISVAPAFAGDEGEVIGPVGLVLRDYEGDFGWEFRVGEGAEGKFLVDFVDANRTALNITGISEGAGTVTIIASGADGEIAQKVVNVKVDDKEFKDTTVVNDEMLVRGSKKFSLRSRGRDVGELEWSDPVVVDGLRGGIAVSKIEEGERIKIKVDAFSFGQYKIKTEVSWKIGGDVVETTTKEHTITVKEDITVNAYEFSGDAIDLDAPLKFKKPEAPEANEEAKNTIDRGKDIAIVVVGGQEVEYNCELTVPEGCGDVISKGVVRDKAARAARAEGNILACVLMVQLPEDDLRAKECKDVEVEINAPFVNEPITKTLNFTINEDPSCEKDLELTIMDSTLSVFTKSFQDAGSGDVNISLPEETGFWTKFEVGGGENDFNYRWEHTVEGISKPDTVALWASGETPSIATINFSYDLGAQTDKIIVEETAGCRRRIERKITFSPYDITEEKLGTVRMHVRFTNNTDHGTCDGTRFKWFLSGEDGVGLIGNDGDEYQADPDDNGNINNASPERNFTSDEIRLSEVWGFRWWTNAMDDGCWSWPDMFIDRVLVEWCPGGRVKDGFNSDKDCLFAAWSPPYGPLGRKDWGDTFAAAMYRGTTGKTDRDNFARRCDGDAGNDNFSDPNGNESDDISGNDPGIWCKENPWPDHTGWHT